MTIGEHFWTWSFLSSFFLNFLFFFQRRRTVNLNQIAPYAEYLKKNGVDGVLGKYWFEFYQTTDLTVESICLGNSERYVGRRNEFERWGTEKNSWTMATSQWRIENHDNDSNRRRTLPGRDWIGIKENPFPVSICLNSQPNCFFRPSMPSRSKLIRSYACQNCTSNRKPRRNWSNIWRTLHNTARPHHCCTITFHGWVVSPVSQFRRRESKFFTISLPC